MIVIIAGEARTWTPLTHRITECPCGSRSVKRTANTWHCTICNETYDEEPWYPTFVCSKHGFQLRYETSGDAYWCTDCEDDAFLDAARNTEPSRKKPTPPVAQPTTATKPRRICTSIKIDDELWRAVKHHCVDADIEICEYLEQLIRDELRK
jgi:hypothetical protein